MKRLLAGFFMTFLLGLLIPSASWAVTATVTRSLTPKSQSFTFTNTTGKSTYFNISRDQDWFGVNLLGNRYIGAGETKTITVGFNSITFQPGTYTGTVTISGGGTVATEPVTLNVLAPVITVDPQSIDVTVTQGLTPHDQSFVVKNIGNVGLGHLNYNFSDDSDWINLNPGAGFGGWGPYNWLYDGETGTVKVAIPNTRGWQTGSHQGTITVSSWGTAVQVPVNLTVLPANINVEPPELTFYYDGGPTPQTQEVSVNVVGYEGSGTFSFGLADNVETSYDWLNTNVRADFYTVHTGKYLPAPSTGKVAVQVYPSYRKLPPAEYEGTVVLWTGSAVVEVPVTLVMVSCIDEDGDGHYAAGALCPEGDDCNDGDPAVSPSAEDVCGDEINNDCDDETDEDCCVDEDGDGYYDSTGIVNAPEPGVGLFAASADDEQGFCPGPEDCNDEDITINPEAEEVCGDGEDNNCDGNKDEGCCVDADGDSYYAITESCPEGTDFDDTDVYSYPNAPEVCDGRDNDNDGETDEGLSWDEDNDGYYGEGSCAEPADDCDDSNGETHPGAEELCDGEDNDCDGTVDEGCCEAEATLWPYVEVWPKLNEPQDVGGITETNVYVWLTKPAPPEGCTIDLKVSPVASAGGHMHPLTGRPTGSFYDENDKEHEEFSFYFDTGEIDAKSIRYQSDEVSGIESIEYKVRETGAAKYIGMQVWVPGLVQLTGNNDYELKCDRYPYSESCPQNGYKHADFYRVLRWVRNVFEDIAADYGQEYPDGPALVVNDGSLKWGGLYDFTNSWKTPHNTHRIGSDIDVRTRDGDLPLENRKDFEDIVCENYGFPFLEAEGTGNEHYHLFFYPYELSVLNHCTEVTTDEI
jgi:hypothetical protein